MSGLRILCLVLAVVAGVPAAALADPTVVTRERTPSGPPPAQIPAIAGDTAAPAAIRNDVVRILAQFGASTRTCTGVMVAPRIAITAGRCVHQGPGGSWALDYWVQPAADGAATPYGQAFGSILATLNEWADGGDPNFDFGFVILDRALGERSGYATPSRSDGCGSYAAALTWVGYAVAGGSQATGSGTPDCSDGALGISASPTPLAGAPVFGTDGRVHGISSTTSAGRTRFTRFNNRVLTYFTNTLLQGVTPCDFRMEADRTEFGAGGGEALVTIGTGPGCAWTLDSTPPSWIEVLSPNGASFGRPIFRAAANAGAKRTAIMTLEGKPFTVIQSAAGPAENALAASASTLGGSIVSTTVSTVGIGRDPLSPSPAGVTEGGSAWWFWTAPTTTTTFVSATSDTFSPAIGIYTGRAGALTLVAEGRDAITFTGTAGTSYVIVVTGGAGTVRLAAQQLFPGAEAQTGWWWNPNEPGRGVFLETNGVNVFFGLFGYDKSGGWQWQVSRGDILDRRAYVGSLASFHHGQALGGPYKAPSMRDSEVLSLSLSSATRGAISLGGVSTAIERFVFAPGGTQADRAPFAPETGWWWTPSEAGTGYAIEVQGSQMMIGIAHFDSIGSPRWSIASGTLLDSRTFDGTLVSFMGGQASGQTYRPPSAAFETGHVAVVFADASHAVVYLPSGRAVAIERFKF